MAFSVKRAEITAEIAQLHRLQMEATKDATFGGWTRESEVTFDKRADRIATLWRELTVLGETKQ